MTLRLRHAALFAALALTVATALGARPPRSGPPPHVLLITLDTVRADHCSAYGYARPTTPALEALARDGVVFDAAYAPMATTAPAHASLFTGLAPAAHGVVKNGLALAPRFRTVAEDLAAAGYETTAVVSSFAVDGRFGLRQGFAIYDDLSDSTLTPDRWHWEGRTERGAFDRDARSTTRRAVHWLRRERAPRPPFFLWVHYFDPHSPFHPAPPYQDLFVDDVDPDDELAMDIARYDAEIRETDDAVGRLLAALTAERLDDQTLVIVAGDHGEGLMDHGWMHHGLQLYEESVRVPLVVRPPKGMRGAVGRRVAEPVQLADLAPTILEIAGVRKERAGGNEETAGGHAPSREDAVFGARSRAGRAGGDGAVEGRRTAPRGSYGAPRSTRSSAWSDGDALSLVPALTGAASLDPARPIFFQRRRYDTTRHVDADIRGAKHAVRRGRWKYIEAPDEGTYELYDLARDPRERRNLARDEPARRQHLADRLSRWRATNAAPVHAAPVPPSAALRLQMLGYVD